MYVNLFPFNALANSVALAVGTSTANVAIPPPAQGNSPNMVSVRVVNSGTNLVWVNFGNSTVTAAIPATTANGAGVALLPNTEKTFLVQAGSYIAAIAAATGNTVYVTAGESE